MTELRSPACTRFDIEFYILASSETIIFLAEILKEISSLQS